MQLHGHKNYQFANLSSNQPAKKSSTKLYQNYNLILAHKGYQNYYCAIKIFFIIIFLEKFSTRWYTFLMQHQFLVVLESKQLLSYDHLLVHVLDAASVPSFLETKSLLSYDHVPPIATQIRYKMANIEIKLHYDAATTITTKP